MSDKEPSENSENRIIDTSSTSANTTSSENASSKKSSENASSKKSSSKSTTSKKSSSKKASSKKSSNTKSSNTKSPNKNSDSTEIFRNRVWEIQSRTHDDDGNPIFTEEEVRKVLDMDKSIIRRYCWILHDKDEYTEIDEYNESARKNPNPKIKAGTLKTAHIHLILEYKNSVYRTALQKRIKAEIGLPANYVRFPSTPVRYNQFMACAAYLTHIDARQQALGKRVYPDECVNYGCCDGMTFEYSLEVKHYLEMMQHIRAGYFSKQTITDMITDIEGGRILPEDIRKNYGYGFYQEHEAKFKKARNEYMKRTFVMPTRVTVYVDGASGSGKSTVAQMIAENLYRDRNLSPNESFFVVGQSNVRFDNYDYQPVLFWDDVRGDNLLSSLGHEEILNLFDTHPRKRTYNVKFGSTILTNSVNLCTGIDSYLTFMELLSGAQRKADNSGLDYTKMEDIIQIFRRIPLVVRVYKSDIELWAFFPSLLSTNGTGRKISKNSTTTYSPETGPYKKISHISLECDIATMKSNYTERINRILSEQITKPIVETIRKYNRLEANIDDNEAMPQITVYDTNELSAIEDKYREDHNAFLAEYEGSDTDSPSYEEWFHKGRPSHPDETPEDKFIEIALRAYNSLVEEITNGKEMSEKAIAKWVDDFDASEEGQINASTDYNEISGIIQHYKQHPDSHEYFTEFVSKMHDVLSRNKPVASFFFKSDDFKIIAHLARESGVISDSTTLKDYIINYGQ